MVLKYSNKIVSIKRYTIYIVYDHNSFIRGSFYFILKENYHDGSAKIWSTLAFNQFDISF